MEPATPILEVVQLTKTFPGQRALDAVSLTVQPGEVHGLVGHNGSGKSTLVKVLSGYHEADAGSVLRLNGRPLGGGVGGARRRLHVVHQELGLVPTLSVADNLALERSGAGGALRRTRRGAEARRARRLMSRYGTDIDVHRLVATLNPGERALVAIARALGEGIDGPELLVLDESTATLHPDEARLLLDAARAVAASGGGVLFVTHRLAEVLAATDRVTVLRDGRVVASAVAAELDERRLGAMIVGADSVADTQAAAAATGEVLLQLDGLSSGPLRTVSLQVRSGEVVGVAGLLGSGRETLLDAIVGARPLSGGCVDIAGATSTQPSPPWALRHGAGYVPGERARTAIKTMSVRENLTLAHLRPFWRRLRLDRGAERAVVATWLDRLGVGEARSETSIGLLSGGNQQKVLLSRWLHRATRVLLLDEPTQGVDVGARATIADIVRQVAADGGAVLVASSEPDFLVAICDRVLVLRDGRITAVVQASAGAATAIVHASLGSAA